MHLLTCLANNQITTEQEWGGRGAEYAAGLTPLAGGGRGGGGGGEWPLTSESL